MTYIPINCDYYDELVLFSMRKELVELVYRSPEKEDKPIHVFSRIMDLFTKNKEEFMQLEDGQLIRLDYLIRVNDKIAPSFC